jgi:hypothetical protein
VNARAVTQWAEYVLYYQDENVVVGHDMYLSRAAYWTNHIIRKSGVTQSKTPCRYLSATINMDRKTRVTDGWSVLIVWSYASRIAVYI